MTKEIKDYVLEFVIKNAVIENKSKLNINEFIYLN